MPGARVHWTLVFTEASLEHLAERNIEAGEVADAVYGQYGPARVRRAGRGRGQRWFVVAPLENGELLTCVFRVVLSRDLAMPGVFITSREGGQEAPTRLDASNASVRQRADFRSGRAP